MSRVTKAAALGLYLLAVNAGGWAYNGTGAAWRIIWVLIAATALWKGTLLLVRSPR